MPFSDRALDEIKDRIDIVDLISDYVHLKKTGQNWKGLCPFHSEKTPSFTVSPAKQIFHCFGCGSGGDIFTFLVRYENLTFPEALRMLAARAGVTLEQAQQSAARGGEKETLLNMHRDALEFFRRSLAGNHRAAEYLGSRGIGADAQEVFSLGYAPKSWNGLLSYLGRRGYKPEAVNKAGLAAKGRSGYYDTFRDRIIFPIYDLKGDVVAFGGRSIDAASEPKYLNSPETPIFNKRRVLYGLHRAKKSIRETGNVLFMEGYIDVITAHVHDFSNAVAPLGTALTQEHGKLIKRFTENVVIVFDSDPAGIKAARNAANILFESGLDVRVLSLPAGQDPDGFLRSRGREAFGRLLEHSLSIIEFHMMQGGDKRLTAREAIETISRVQDRVLQGEYVKMLSEKLGINEVFVMEELRKKTGRTGRRYRTPAPAQARPAPPSIPLYELYIIRILLQMPEKAGEVSGILSEDDFRDAAARGIFRKIREGTTGLKELMSRCGDSERDLLSRISLADDFEEPEKVLRDCIKRLKDDKLGVLLQEIQKKIKDAELKKDFDLLRNLQKEQQELLCRRAIEK